MQLHLENMDARDIVADVQYVKHFHGRLGGAEEVLDKGVGGRIQQLFHSLENYTNINSQIIKVPNYAKIRSKYLLVLGLGRMSQFSTAKLQSGLIHAIEKSLQRNFEKIATPVIGINPRVGLNIQEAYPLTLKTILGEISKYDRQGRRNISITDITIFDFNAEKTRFYRSVTESILAESRVQYERVSNTSFYIYSEFEERDSYRLSENTEFTHPIKQINLSRNDRIELRKKLETFFNAEELTVLCFDLGINIENIHGNTRQVLTTSLIEYCYRHDLMTELLESCTRERPHVYWYPRT